MVTQTTAIPLITSVAMMVGMNTAGSAELKVLASPGVKEVLLDLVPAFERASGHKVTLAWGGNEDLVKRVRAGEMADLVIMARANIDKLVADGKLVAGSAADIAKSGVGVAVRAGLPKPDLSSADTVKAAVLTAKSVAYCRGRAGTTWPSCS